MSPSSRPALRPRWQRAVLIAAIVVAALAGVMFGVRTYRSFLLLRSAQELGASDLGAIRPWMTLRYVATTYGVPQEALTERLGLPEQTDSDTSLYTLARQQGRSPLEYTQEVQRAIVAIRQVTSPSDGSGP
ncbi:MAG: hypothetical protein HY689_16180 [Chloroflexi bacterium]|nr:hypothetical protein [Chloroflexota bacterium]